jgi:DNA-binding response OmpR family regulator
MVSPEPEARPPRVLICEDAPGYRMLLEVSLADAGLHVVAGAASWDEATAAAREHQPDLVLVDLWLPYRDDAALIALRGAAGGALLVVISGLSVQETTKEVGDLGAVDLILSKRQPMGELMATLRERLDAR